MNIINFIQNNIKETLTISWKEFIFYILLFISLFYGMLYFEGDHAVSKETKYQTRLEICKLEELAYQIKDRAEFIEKIREGHWPMIKKIYVNDNITIPETKYAAKKYYRTIITFQTRGELPSLTTNWELKVYFTENQLSKTIIKDIDGTQHQCSELAGFSKMPSNYR